jgi:ABC-2 type transport system ATP-binding protein
MLAATENLAFSYRDSIEDSIGENRVEDALSTLQDLVSNLAPELKNSVLMLRRRYSQYRQDRARNVADEGEADSITESLLSLLSEAQRRPIVAPKYAISGRGQSNNQADVSERSFALIRASTEVENLQSTVGSDQRESAANTAEEKSSEGETLDEQLRDYWRRYRDSRPPKETVAFSCEKITKRFRSGNFRLAELSFFLRTGQITGVVGRNASGKTTLLRIVRGELAQDSGNTAYPALTGDEDNWSHIKRQIAYIPQFPAPWGGSVQTNLNYLAAVNGSRGKRNRDLVDWYIERYGLSKYRHSSCSELSGGFQMRYELVRALISKPRLLVLDEPLASLDVLARQEFLRNLRAIAYSLEDPVPILVTSQHLYEIEAIADQMIVLEGGNCLFCGPLDELEDQSSLRFYELNIRSSKRSVQRMLEGTQMKVLEVLSDGYIVSVPREVSVREAITLLTKKLGHQLIGVRDITCSSRRFFLESETERSGGERDNDESAARTV